MSSIDPRIEGRPDSFMYVACPDNKVRRVTHIYQRTVSPSTNTMHYMGCAIRLYNTLVKGWRDQTTGKFVPNADHHGFALLVELGAIDSKWTDVAMTDEQLQKAAISKRNLSHTYCAPPPCPPGFNPESWQKGIEKFWVGRTLESGHVVHGSDTDGYFAVEPSCPNAHLWVPPLGTDSSSIGLGADSPSA